MLIETFKQLINVTAGRQFCVSKSPPSGSRKPLEILTRLINTQKLDLKITSILALFLALIFIAKIIYWLKTDEPISRGSMLILALYILFLTIRNKYTFFLLGGLGIFCIVYKYTHFNWSGFLVVDFMASLRKPMGSLNKVVLYTPFVVYILSLFLLILPTTRKIYFNSKSSQ